MKLRKLFCFLFFISAIVVINCENDAEPGNQVGEASLVVEPTSLQLSGSPMYDVVTLFNKGYSGIQWSVASAPSWLAVVPQSGEITSDTVQVQLATDFDALDYGDYNEVIKITSNAGSFDIHVNLKYVPPLLKISNPVLNLDRHYSYGDLMIENAGGGGLEWEITQSPDWLDFEILSDIVYGRPQAIPFRVNMRKLEYGDYKDAVEIESSAGSETVTVYMSYHREEEVYPGLGAANIELGYAYDRVKKIWGNPDKNWYIRPEKTVFFHYFVYYDLGLEFFVQNNSPILYGSGPVGYIKVFAPYDGLTQEKRIGIGSTLTELLTAYGDPTSIEDTNYYYDIGITFQVENDLVTAMIIQ